MAALADLMRSSVWFDRAKYEEAEYKYQEYLVRKSQTTSSVSASVVGDSKKVSEEKKGNLSQQIKEVREKMQESLKDASPGSDADAVRQQVENLRKQNEKLQSEVMRLNKQFSSMEARITVLEKSRGNSNAQDQKPVQNGVAAEEQDDDDDDIDLFGSTDEEEEAEAERIKAERVKAYHERKATKKAVIAKSSIILDVKPWDDETDLQKLEECVRSITMDGLLWGASKLVKIAFGIQKLQITCVVEDDKVGTDDLEEKITGFEDYVQSMDIVAFNKI